jgi:hypothetical protein
VFIVFVPYSPFYIWEPVVLVVLYSMKVECHLHFLWTLIYLVKCFSYIIQNSYM